MNVITSTQNLNKSISKLNNQSIVDFIVRKSVLNSLTKEIDFNIYVISRDESDILNDFPILQGHCTHISSTGYRNQDKLSHSKLMSILEEINSESSVVIIKDYLDSVNVYDKGDKRFISQMHSLRMFKGVMLVGYDRDNFISLTDNNINISYHKNNSDNAKNLHRDLRNPNVAYLINLESEGQFVPYDDRPNFTNSPSPVEVLTEEELESLAQLQDTLTTFYIFNKSKDFINYDLTDDTLTKNFINHHLVYKKRYENYINNHPGIECTNLVVFDLDNSGNEGVARRSLGYKKEDYFNAENCFIPQYLSVKNFVLAYYSVLTNKMSKEIALKYDTKGGKYFGLVSRREALLKYITEDRSYVHTTRLGPEYVALARMILYIMNNTNVNINEAISRIAYTLYPQEVAKINAFTPPTNNN